MFILQPKTERGEPVENSTCPKLPHILAWMEGYICFSFIVIVISLSRIAVTRWRRASSLCLQKRTRFNNQGVIYSRQRCFSSIPEIQINRDILEKKVSHKSLPNYLLEQNLVVMKKQNVLERQQIKISLCRRVLDWWSSDPPFLKGKLSLAPKVAWDTVLNDKRN